jgi:hypothetical protein
MDPNHDILFANKFRFKPRICIVKKHLKDFFKVFIQYLLVLHLRVRYHNLHRV